jgi:SAM-dependent methyltransferase
VCGTTLNIGSAPWHFNCPACGYERSNLISAINDPEVHQNINESFRENGLHPLRASNFKTLVDQTKKFNAAASPPSLLDVGAAHGWFLDAAKSDFQVLGIEPDEATFAKATAQNRSIRCGYFPDVLKKGERFDVIVFNDVIEHMPDIESVLKECHTRLNASGLLVLNLPCNKGIFYRVAKIFNKMGVHGFFERLWQKGMPSPHVHYFNEDNLKTLVSRLGFTEVYCGTLPSLRLRGLYARISYSGNINIINRVVLYVCIALSLPFLSLLPKDIMYGIYRRVA